MPNRTAPLLRLVAAITLVLALIDALVFRSGAYTPWIEPDSTAGSVVATTLAINRYYDPARRNILVLGNSQIGEGFSAPLADAASERSDLHFINGSVAGTTPRLWNYLLRHVDPNADRFAAIVMTVDYDAHEQTDFTNYTLDTSYAIPLLHIGDLIDYPASFTAADQREHARRAILFPLQTLHTDVAAFVEKPRRRIHDVTQARQDWLAAVAAYPGRDEALPQLPIDVVTGLPSDWGTHAAELRPLLENYFRNLRASAPPGLQEANQVYLRTWIGRIAQRYRAHGVPVIVFCMPRGPWKSSLLPVPTLNVALAELRDADQILVLPGDAFTALEQPQFFFDTLHMNRAGRERFSQMFAQRIAALIR
jgi:lysophospholipase L1-like esterase